MCWATVGVHPHEADACTPATWRELEALAEAPKVIAMGETGLDYYRNLAAKHAQQDAFSISLPLPRRLICP